jgi:hypothetical protein
MSQEHGGLRVSEEILQSVLRQSHVQGQACSTCFQDTENGDTHVQGAVKADGHRHVRTHPMRLKRGSQSLRPSSQFCIGECLMRVPYGNGIRRSPCLLVHQLVQACRGSGSFGIATPLLKDHAPFRFGKDRKIVDGMVWRDRALVQQRPQMIYQPRHARCIE